MVVRFGEGNTMKKSIGSCGETSERTAAGMHGLVAILYAVMLIWHTMSVVKHWDRQ